MNKEIFFVYFAKIRNVNAGSFATYFVIARSRTLGLSEIHLFTENICSTLSDAKGF